MSYLTRRGALKLAMAGAVGPLLTAATLKADKAPSPESDGSKTLAERAAHFRQLVLDVANGPGGMIISFPRFDTRRPFQEGAPIPQFAVRAVEKAWVVPHPTTAEWLYGENTLWATGWFLYSQILRYRATGDSEAKLTAQKCFRDLCNIFRLSETIEPGLLGKPHGGRPGPTTSYDQSACPVIFFTLYAQELGSAEEKAEAARYMARHGEYYLRHNWVMNHFGHLQRVVQPGGTSTMKYLACEYAAFQITGETRFRDAALKHMRELIKAGKFPWPTRLYETNHNLFYYSLLCDFWSKTEIGSEVDWRGCIREYWRAAKTSLADDGLPRLGLYDTQRGTFAPYPTTWSPPDHHSWQSATLYPNGGLVRAADAGLGILARSHGWDDKADLVSRRILLRMNEDSLRWFWGEDPKFPQEMQPVRNIFATEVAGMWQIAYWLGRLQKTW